METLINPAHRSGEKNISCPYYSTCLDHAVKNFWDFWRCDSCDYKTIKEPLKNIKFWIDDGTPFYSLGKP